MAFSIIRESSKRNNRFKLNQYKVEFKLNHLDEKVDKPEEWLKDGLRAIYNHIVNSLDATDKMGMTFTATDFETDFHIPFKEVSKHSFEELWGLLHLLYQSRKGAVEGDTFKIITTSFTPLKGSGRSTEESLTFEEDCSKRRGIVCIKNKDNLCLPRALVVAIAYLLNVPYLRQVRRNIGRRQDEEAQKLIADSGVIIPPEGAGIKELQQFQQHLSDFKIVVYNYNSKGRDVMYQGPDARKTINLIHHDNHFNVITSLTSAFCCRYYCQQCHVPHNNKDRHRCKGQCPGCRKEPPCQVVSKEILCQDCNRQFRGQTCYDNHKVVGKAGKTHCDIVKRCRDCFHFVKEDRQHFCDGEIFCRTCKKHQPKGHLCYIQQDIRVPKLDDTLFVFYDLETRQDVQNRRGENVHMPVLCVFQQRCSQCFDIESTDLLTCSKCGVRRQILKDGDIIASFFNYIWNIGKKFKSTIVVAHNGQGYDHQFIFRHMLEKTDLKPEIIKRGTKLLMLTIGRKIKLIDSFNYFPMKLATLPKAFGLEELKKGYFPHLFNTLANRNYIGPLPERQHYSPDTMKSGERAEFLKWYVEHQNDVFDLQKEMVDYCVSDVEILTQTCIKFHEMLMEAGSVSPFTEAITIPGACNKLFRRKFLMPNTISILPKNGYRNADPQSKIATQWLIYEENQRGINIQHSAKQREAVIDGVKVDGYCPETRQVFEFHGCYFHGCPRCFSNTDREARLHEDQTDCLDARYERTLKKEKKLREKGFEVIVKWEHEFREELKKYRELRLELDNHPLIAYSPLNPRDAFYGGRTGCTKSFYKVRPNEKIKYVDVCSLYPWVCKYGKFPIGHPTAVLVGEECKDHNLSLINGLIKCKILPPSALYHPVLPAKMNNKLMFILCRTCGETLCKEECNHNEEQRALIGTWVIDEVNKAIEKGYKVLERYEIWVYEITQFDKGTNTGGLFTPMINKFLQIKQQASGWPASCTSEEEKETYIETFLEQECIQLEYGEIEKNPGLRSLAKLILNSFWGKFGQRQNQAKSSILRQPAELYDLDNNPSINLNHISVINENVLIASWEYKEEAADTLDTVNVVTAGFVTTGARLKLYSYLEKLGERVLYYDTDSIIYISREGEWDVPTGSGLGEMTDELGEYGPGSYITEFCSAGPKNYSFVVHSPTTGAQSQVCKVKGFNLNYQVGQLINTEVMKQMVKGQTDSVPIHQNQIRRSNTHQLITLKETKVYRVCLEKRKFTDDHESLPYGFKKLKQ